MKVAKDPFRASLPVSKGALEQQHFEGLRQKAEKESADKEAALATLEELKPDVGCW